MNVLNVLFSFFFLKTNPRRILKMQEMGLIEDFRKQWFLKDSKCREEQKSDTNTKADAIQLQTIGGAFYVLMMGGILAFVAVFIEHVWHKPSFYRKKRKELKGNRDRVSILFFYIFFSFFCFLLFFFSFLFFFT